MLRRNSFSCSSKGSVSGTVSLCLNPEMGDVWGGEEGRCEGGEEGKWTEEGQERQFLTCISLDEAPTFCSRSNNRRDTRCTSDGRGA